MNDQDHTTSPMANQDPVATPQPVSVGIAKEQEMPVSTEAPIEDIIEQEVPSEVKIHVAKTVEKIDVPPDLQQVGVVAPAQDVTVTQAMQQVGPKLPLSDDQIAVGLHVAVKNSLRWLAEWCLKQLKKAHYHLTQVGGRVIRMKD